MRIDTTQYYGWKAEFEKSWTGAILACVGLLIFIVSTFLFVGEMG